MTERKPEIFIPTEKLLKAFLDLQKELLDEVFQKSINGIDYKESQDLLDESRKYFDELKKIYSDWSIKIQSSILVEGLTRELVLQFNKEVSPYYSNYLNLKAKVLTSL